MIAREEILNEVSRLHRSFYADAACNQAITDYIVRLLGDQSLCRDCDLADSCTEHPYTEGCDEKIIDTGGGYEQHCNSLEDE